MGKLKLFKLIALVVLIGAVFTFFNLWLSERKKAERWEDNYKQTDQQYQELNMTWREFRDSMEERDDSIIKALNTRPKWVREINNIHHHHHDSTTVVIYPDPVILPSGTIYPFIDTNECFTIGGHMEVDPLDFTPALTINQREYDNEIIQIFYKKRRRILGFIPWRFENYQEVSSTCGTNEVQRINIIKRK